MLADLVGICVIVKCVQLFYKHQTRPIAEMTQPVSRIRAEVKRLNAEVELCDHRFAAMDATSLLAHLFEGHFEVWNDLGGQGPGTWAKRHKADHFGG